MALGETLEITDAWLELPPDREEKVIVAAARALGRRAEEFTSASDALAALGLHCSGRALDASEITIDDTVDLGDGSLLKALAAGVEDGFLYIWDTRYGRREVYRINFDGEGHYSVHQLVAQGGRGCGCA